MGEGARCEAAVGPAQQPLPAHSCQPPDRCHKRSQDSQQCAPTVCSTLVPQHYGTTTHLGVAELGGGIHHNGAGRRVHLRQSRRGGAVGARTARHAGRQAGNAGRQAGSIPASRRALKHAGRQAAARPGRHTHKAGARDAQGLDAAGHGRAARGLDAGGSRGCAAHAPGWSMGGCRGLPAARGTRRWSSWSRSATRQTPARHWTGPPAGTTGSGRFWAGAEREREAARCVIHPPTAPTRRACTAG